MRAFGEWVRLLVERPGHIAKNCPCDCGSSIESAFIGVSSAI